MTIAIATEVTFGGSGLDRAADLRDDNRALELARETGTARVLLFWRGLVLCSAAPEGLSLLPLDHRALAEAIGVPIFLGRANKVHYFACDISGWDPETGGGWTSPDGIPHHPSAPKGAFLADLRGVMERLSPLEAELAATARALLNWHQGHLFCARCGQPSQMAEMGWQRVCLSCEARHFPRTDPVVIMLITRGNSILLGRSPGWAPGMMSLLAGFVEPGETIEAAVRREVLEESAIEVGDVDYLCCQPWPFPNSLMFACRGEALNERIIVDPKELEAAEWVTRDEVAEMLSGTHPRFATPRKGAVAEFVLRNWLADRLG